MKVTTFLFFIALIGLFACQQEDLPEDRLEDAEIYFFGKQNGENVLMIAGEDSLYNYTSMRENEHHIYEFSSKLGHLKSPNDKSYLEIIIWDAQSTESPSENDNRYEKGERRLLLQSEYIESNTFRMLPILNEVVVEEYFWELGSFGKSRELEPEAILKGSGSEWICLTGVSAQEDSLLSCKRVSVTDPDLYSPILKIEDATSESVSLTANIKGVEPDQWIWDGQTGNDQSVEFDVEELLTDPWHSVKLLKNGVELFSSDFLLDTINGQIELKYLDFSTMKLDRQYADFQQSGKVIVNYFLPEKGLFSSRFTDENRNQTFTIEKDFFFSPNEQGVPTRKLNFRFDLPLVSEIGDTIQLNTSESIMAFPNP